MMMTIIIIKIITTPITSRSLKKKKTIIVKFILIDKTEPHHTEAVTASHSQSQSVTVSLPPVCRSLPLAVI